MKCSSIEERIAPWYKGQSCRAIQQGRVSTLFSYKKRSICASGGIGPHQLGDEGAGQALLSPEDRGGGSHAKIRPGVRRRLRGYKA